MMIDTKNLVSITEANQNFSQVAKKVDKAGTVFVLKNNKPQYIITSVDNLVFELTENEKLEIIAKRILREHEGAFKELAQ